MAYAPDVHVAIYQVLDEVLGAPVPPPGAKATIHSIAPANLSSQRVAQKLGSRNMGPGRLPPPFADDPIDLWGQSREEWRRRDKA